VVYKKFEDAYKLHVSPALKDLLAKADPVVSVKNLSMEDKVEKELSLLQGLREVEEALRHLLDEEDLQDNDSISPLRPEISPFPLSRFGKKVI